GLHLQTPRGPTRAVRLALSLTGASLATHDGLVELWKRTQHVAHRIAGRRVDECIGGGNKIDPTSPEALRNQPCFTMRARAKRFRALNDDGAYVLQCLLPHTV